MYLGHTFWRHFGVIWQSPATSERNVKAKPRKTKNVIKSGLQNRSPKSEFFVVFGVWLRRCARVVPSALFVAPGWSQGPSQDTNNEPKGTKIGPKDPTEHPARSNLVESCAKTGARNCISVMSYWVWSQTESTCPQVLPRCSQMCPDASISKTLTLDLMGL